MKATPAIFASFVLLTSGAALAADTPRPDRAAAVKHCESLSNPEQTRCMREVRNTYDDKREVKSAKDDYWSPERMAARAKQRVKNAANKAERALDTPRPDRAAAVKHCESLSETQKARCMREVRNTYDEGRVPKSAKDDYWSPGRMAARAKQRIKSAANKVERALERKQEPDNTTRK